MAARRQTGTIALFDGRVDAGHHIDGYCIVFKAPHPDVTCYRYRRVDAGLAAAEAACAAAAAAVVVSVAAAAATSGAGDAPSIVVSGGFGGGFSGQALFAAWEANACGALAVALWPDADRNAVALVVGESRDGEDGVLGAGSGLV